MAINLDHQRNRIASTTEVLTINNTGSLIVPKGTTVQRPGTDEGQIRYNSNNLKLEQYVGSNWKNVSSVENISELSDVSISNISGGHILKYSGGSFQNEELKLTSLSDVTISGTPLDKQVLKYDNSSNVFKAYTLELNDLSDISYSGTPAQDKILKTNNSGTFVLADPYTSASFDTDFATKDLNDLNNVSGTPQTGYFLKYTSNGWEPAAMSAVGSSNLDDLADVSVSSPSNGQLLKWNGSSWVAGSAPAPSLATTGLTDVRNVTPSNGQIFQYDGTNTRWEPVDNFSAGTGINISGAKVITVADNQIDHNSLQNYVANQHVDWAVSQTINIHEDNYTNTTYTASNFNHNDLANVPTNDHIDWTVNQSSNNYEINVNNYTNWRLDQPGSTMIHPNNYINTTYSANSFNHDDLANVPANNHIDWTVSQSGTVIHSDNYTNVSYSDFNGATASGDGGQGLVPKPYIGDHTKFLKGDGSWGNPAGNFINTTYTLSIPVNTRDITLTGSDSTTDKVSINGSNGITVTRTSDESLNITGDHDQLSNYISNEHIDWTVDQGTTNIDTGNYINTTYTGGSGINIDSSNVITVVQNQISHNNLSNVVANQHIDWTVSQTSQSLTIHGDNFVASPNTTYDLTTSFNNSTSLGRVLLTGSDNTNDDFYLGASGATSIAYDSTSRKFTFSSTDTTYAPGTGIQFSGLQISTKDDEIDHNSLQNYDADQHIDWTQDQGGTDIHVNNYTNTQYSVFNVNNNGLVPYPPAATNTKFLAADGTWINPATSSSQGISEGDAIAFVIALGG